MHLSMCKIKNYFLYISLFWQEKTLGAASAGEIIIINEEHYQWERWETPPATLRLKTNI